MKLADVPTNTMFVAEGPLYLKIQKCPYTKSILQEWRTSAPLNYTVCLLIPDDDEGDFELYILHNDIEVTLYER